MPQPKIPAEVKYKRARQMLHGLETTPPPSSADSETSQPTANRSRALRLRQANRAQVTQIPARLEALLPPDHLARLIWEAVERLDLSAFYEPIQASP